MSVLFINYPKCSTCVNARKWLEENKLQQIEISELFDIWWDYPTKNA